VALPGDEEDGGGPTVVLDPGAESTVVARSTAMGGRTESGRAGVGTGSTQGQWSRVGGMKF
jgi:hypothetical protein